MQGIIKTDAGKEIQAPVFNLNGSAASTLFDAYYSAFKALRSAEELLRQTTPHGRDYQTVNAGEYERARSEHIARLKSVSDAMTELEALALHAMEARDSAKPY